MKYIPRDCTNEILATKDFDKRLIDLKSNSEHSFKPRIYIQNMENNIVLGTIQQPRVCPCCCSDANYEIYPRYPLLLKAHNVLIVVVPDCSCAEGETLFNIFSNALRIYSGNILKRSFNRDRKDYLFYDIDFPDDASPEEKVLIICATIGIDNVVYKELGSNI